jgi:VWFA-related protein
MLWACLLLALLPPLRAQAPEAPETTPVFRAGVSDVRVEVQVTEDNKTVKGLTRADFVITDEGAPQTVVACDQEHETLNLLLLLDISGSMREHVQEMSDKAREALRFLAPRDRIAIMTFAAKSNLHFDWFDNHAEVARQLRTAADDQEVVGYGTAINWAVLDASRFMARSAESGRRAILMVTDNLCLNYKLNDRMAVGYLLRADTVFNAIVVGRGIRPGPPKPGDNPDFTPADVFYLSDATGGEAVRAERAAAFFPEMVSRIRDRYSLSYHLPEGAVVGRFRGVKVNLTPAARRLHPTALIRAREGYYVRQ